MHSCLCYTDIIVQSCNFTALFIVTVLTNTGETRYGRRKHETGSFGDDMLRPSPSHGTQRLPNDDDDDLPLYNADC